MTTYNTTFAATENPISDSGKWVNGGTTGLDWANVSSSAGRAIGNQTGGTGTDATAVLGGLSFAADQQCQATVFIDSVPGATCAPEIELRLRSVITPHSNRGYEISFGLSGYLLIVRWDGALGAYTYLLNMSAARFAPANGDVLTARVVGNVISAYKNGVLMGRAVDSTWTNGSPGIGFNLENGGTTCAGANVNYGMTAFTATDVLTVPTADAIGVGALGDNGDASLATIAIVLERDIKRGDAVAVLLTFGSTTATGTALDDGSSGRNIYVKQATINDAGNGQRSEVWVCARAQADVAAPVTINATLSASVGTRTGVAYQNRGRYTLGPVVGALTTGPAASANTVSSGAAAVAGSYLAVGFAVDTGAQPDHNWSAGTGYTLQGQVAGSICVAVEDRLVSVAGAVAGVPAATFTPAATDNGVAFLVVLYPDPIVPDYTTFPKQPISDRALGLS